MKKLMMIAAIACMTAKADQWEPMLEAPQSGDKVVMNDQTYILFTEADFTALTNKMTILVSLAHKQWNNQHKTEEGRRAWHGEKGTTTVTTNASGRLVKVVEYADGYRHVEESEIRKTHVRPVPSRREEIRREIRKTDIPKRLREARQGVNVNKEVN